MTAFRHQLATIATLAAIALLSACGQPSAAQGQGPMGPPQVSVAPAVLKPTHDVEEFTGRLEAPQSVDLRSRIAGNIEKIDFSDGALVKKNQVLFEIDRRPYEATLARYEAQLAAARAQADLAHAELGRAEKLLDAKAVSRQEYDQLASAARSGDANVQTAEASVRSAKLDLDYTQVRTPISGRVSRRNVTLGNLIDDKTVLTTIVKTDRIYAYFDGSESTFLRLRGQQPGQVEVQMGLANEPGLPHSGHLDFIDNQLNPQTGAIRLRAVFANPNGDFIPGLFARMRLTGTTVHDTVLTPDRAIGTDQSKKFVLVLGSNNVVESRTVETGPLQDGMRAIETGLKAGELVVVDGLQRARPGAPVTPLKLDVDARGMPIVPPPAAAPGAAPAKS